MKGKLLLTLLAMTLLTPLSSAESLIKKGQRNHYKCHVLLVDKSEVVHQFVSVGETQNEFEDGLLGMIVYDAGGASGIAIEKIYQCVAADQRFATSKARALEENTPF